MDNKVSDEIGRYFWYHCIDLGSGDITDGDYDMTPLLHHYGFPDDMKGMTVLDVGRGSGFFSFEFEKRGAEVIATEIGSILEWDFRGGQKKREVFAREIGDESRFSDIKIHGAFRLAKRIKKSQIQDKIINVYDLSPAAFGGRKFDLVFAGSLLTHLRDPILALEKLYTVTNGKLILATPVRQLDPSDELPLMSLVPSPPADPRNWWIMNKKCILTMLECANFTNIEIISEFVLENRRVKGVRPPHVVVHSQAP